jgi:DNA-binding NarL/FixJ family response regulator
MTSSTTDRSSTRTTHHTALSTPPRSPVLVAAPGEPELIRRGLKELLEPFDTRVRLLEAEAGPCPSVEVVLYDCCPEPHPPAHVTTRLPDFSAGVTVAYSWHSNPELVAWALEHGFAGYLSKALPIDELVAALEAIRDGRTVVLTTRSDGGRAVERFVAVERFGLTPRECEVLMLVCSGLSNAEIAESLHLSSNSVKSYIRSAYRRIGAASRAQAVLWGVEHGFGNHPDAEMDR